MLVLMQLLKALKNRGANLDMIQTCVSRIKTVSDARAFLSTYIEEVRPSHIESLLRVVERGTYISAFEITKLN